jgi:two-component system response regulator (stage 0 sporulation protein A)
MPSAVFPRSRRERIIHSLLESGFPAHKKGFVYLCEAIETVSEDPLAIELVTKILYQDIAKRHNTTVSCVVHAIRRVIRDAWKRGGADVSSTPTNCAFIAEFAYQMTRDVKYGPQERLRRPG